MEIFSMSKFRGGPASKKLSKKLSKRGGGNGVNTADSYVGLT
jgi:hypothetical protein